MTTDTATGRNRARRSPSDTSPGEATARRAALEAQTVRAADAALRAFLVEVEAAALTYGFTASILDSFSLGHVTHRWRETARQVVKPVARLFGVRDPSDEALAAHPYLSGMYERVRRADLPDKAYSAARAVLGEAAAQGWSHDRTAREMGRAMDAWTSALVPGRDGLEHEGVTWATQMHRIARTETTAAYNFHAIEELSQQGYAEKRWVAHHDEITRDTHLAADGQTQPLSSPFEVGGELLMVPADPAGSPAVTYNCRCVIVGARDSLTAGYNPDQPRDSKGRWAQTMSVAMWDDMEQRQYAELGGTAVDEAVSEYANGLYEPINEYCRFGGDPRQPLNGGQTVTDYTALMDEGFDAMPGLPQTTLVYRGVRGMTLYDSFTDHGYMSTSIDKRLATNFGEVVTIIVPKGTPVLTGNSGEHELIFPRGGTLVRRAKGVYEWTR